MPWFKVDDNLAFHSKTVDAGNAAMGLWVRAGSWCAQNLTDGFLPGHMLPMLGTAQQAARLVRAGLWNRESGGFSFHEWGERQPKREAIENERAAARERMRAAREAKRGKKTASPQVSGESSPEVPRTGPDVFGNPDPTRPDPTHTTTDVVVCAASAATLNPRPKRASQLPADWQPSDAHRSLANERGVDIAFEADKFRDWCASKGEARKDWEATFRNWLRNSRPSARPGGTPRQQADAEMFERMAQRAEARESTIRGELG